MSSEESAADEESNGESPRSVIHVKPLPWRASSVSRFCRQLDHKIDKQKTKRAKLQTLPRVTGQPSTRPQPPDFPAGHWGFVQGKY